MFCAPGRRELGTGQSSAAGVRGLVNTEHGSASGAGGHAARSAQRRDIVLVHWGGGADQLGPKPPSVKAKTKPVDPTVVLGSVTVRQPRSRLSRAAPSQQPHRRPYPQLCQPAAGSSDRPPSASERYSGGRQTAGAASSPFWRCLHCAEPFRELGAAQPLMGPSRGSLSQLKVHAARDPSHLSLVTRRLTSCAIKILWTGPQVYHTGTQFFTLCLHSCARTTQPPVSVRAP